MEDNNAKIAKKDGLGRRLAAWIKHHSPFAFETLEEIPWPTWTVPVTLLFFCLIWRGYAKNIDSSYLISSELAYYVHRERGDSPLKPEMVVLGSSLPGMAIHSNTLSQKFNCRVAKICMGVCSIRESANILKKYEDVFQNCKVLLVEFSQISVCHDKREPLKKRFHFLKKTFDLRYSYMGLPLADRLLPMRHSLKEIRAAQDKINSCNKLGHEAIWHDKRYHAINKKYVDNIQTNIERYRENAKKGNPNTRIWDLAPELCQEAQELIDYCKTKGIFVVFFVTPMETLASTPIKAGLPETYYQYFATLTALQNRPDCMVSVASNFSDIMSPRDYSKEPALTFDSIHMTEEGATIYTNWLANQIQKNPSVMAALNTPRVKEEFFVKKYAKKGYRKMASYLKKSGNTGPVQVAETPGNTVR